MFLKSVLSVIYLYRRFFVACGAYLHFRYLDLISIVLSAEIVPRPRSLWIWIRICRTRHQIAALHLLCVALLQLQLQGLVYHRATLEDHCRSSSPTGA